jgi:hypothetical protein
MITESKIIKKLEEYTAANSHFETARNYLSLSHAALPAGAILEQYEKGFEDSLATRLKCYKGYQMERDLLGRIKAVFGNDIETGLEISAFDGLVKGHPDFFFKGAPADVKSVLLDDWLPVERLPRKVFYQMQAYMKYSGRAEALVIYESRETGNMRAFFIPQNWRIQEEIDGKYSQIVEQINSRKELHEQESKGLLSALPQVQRPAERTLENR